MTGFKVAGEKLYLSPMMDLYNGEITAHEMSAHLVLKFVIQMLQKAKTAQRNRSH